MLCTYTKDYFTQIFILCPSQQALVDVFIDRQQVVTKTQLKQTKYSGNLSSLGIPTMNLKLNSN